MENTKVCMCGDKEITISAETKVSLRDVTDGEREEYLMSHWKITPMPQFDSKFWIELGVILESGVENTHLLAVKCAKAKGIQKDGECFTKFHSINDRADIELGYERLLTQKDHDEAFFAAEPGKAKYSIVDVGKKLIEDYIRFCYPEDMPELFAGIKDYLDCQYSNLLFTKKKVKGLSPKDKELENIMWRHKDYIKQLVENQKGLRELHQKKEYNIFDRTEYRVLCVDDNKFFEMDCGFDVHKKCDEIQNTVDELKRTALELEKTARELEKNVREFTSEAHYEESVQDKRTSDAGEDNVDYALKWIVAELGDSVAVIKKNCESKYRKDCILLMNSEFIDEPQEYDNILVCQAGVILIETKHWKGKIQIRPDGKWVRTPDDGSEPVGIESPAYQLRRHEVLVRSILPDIPVFSVLCFSNDSAILEGESREGDGYRITYADQLRDTIMDIIECNGDGYTAQLNDIVQEIERHKVK